MKSGPASGEMKPIAIEIPSRALIPISRVLDESPIEDGGCLAGSSNTIEAGFHYYKVDNSIIIYFIQSSHLIE